MTAPAEGAKANAAVETFIAEALDLPKDGARISKEMEISQELQMMSKGLVLHFLHGRTIDEAVQDGEQAGLPEDLLGFPEMMFNVTSAAGAVFVGGKTLNQVLDKLVKEGAPRNEARRLVSMALDFMETLAAKHGREAPVPQLDVPWYAYEG